MQEWAFLSLAASTTFALAGATFLSSHAAQRPEAAGVVLPCPWPLSTSICKLTCHLCWVYLNYINVLNMHTMYTHTHAHTHNLNYFK